MRIKQNQIKKFSHPNKKLRVESHLSKERMEQDVMKGLMKLAVPSVSSPIHDDVASPEYMNLNDDCDTSSENFLSGEEIDDDHSDCDSYNAQTTSSPDQQSADVACVPSLSTEEEALRLFASNDDVRQSLLEKKVFPVGGKPRLKDIVFRNNSINNYDPGRCVQIFIRRSSHKETILSENFSIPIRIVECFYKYKITPPKFGKVWMFVIDSKQNSVVLPNGEIGRYAFTSLFQLYIYALRVKLGERFDKNAFEKALHNNLESYVYTKTVSCETKTYLHDGTPYTGPEDIFECSDNFPIEWKLFPKLTKIP